METTYEFIVHIFLLPSPQCNPLKPWPGGPGLFGDLHGEEVFEKFIDRHWPGETAPHLVIHSGAQLFGV